MKNLSLKRFDIGTDIETLKNVMEEDGALVLKSALGAEQLKALYSDLDDTFTNSSFCDGLFYGGKTKRIHSLIAKSVTCQSLATNQTILGVARELMGPYCEKIQINITQGIQIHPGERMQVPHRDDAMFSQMGHNYSMINALWAYSDFTKENGATFLALGSHKWEDKSRLPAPEELTYAEMSAGDVLIYVASLIHGGGQNITSTPRTAVVIGYCLGWLRQSENQYLAVPPYVAKNLSKELQDLLGYSVHRPNLGMYEGNEPNIIFTGADLTSLVTHDWMLPEHNKIIAENYDQLMSPYLAA